MMPPLMVIGCTKSPNTVVQKPTDTHLWKEQEKIINDKIAAEEYKINKDIRECKAMGTLVHTLGFPRKFPHQKMVGIYGEMDLIRE